MSAGARRSQAQESSDRAKDERCAGMFGRARAGDRLQSDHVFASTRRGTCSRIASVEMSESSLLIEQNEQCCDCRNSNGP